MISKLLRFIDSLFYTRVIITKKTHIATPKSKVKDAKAPPPVVSFKDKDQIAICLNATEDELTIDGIFYKIPKQILTKPSLITDGNYCYSSFPHERYSNIISSYETETMSLAFFNDIPLNRTDRYHKFTKKSILEMHDASLLEQSSGIDIFKSSADLGIGYTTVDFIRKDKRLFFILRDEASTYRMVVRNTMQTTDVTVDDCIIQAHILSRAISLLYASTKHEIQQDDEDKLIVVILSLLLINMV